MFSWRLENGVYSAMEENIDSFHSNICNLEELWGLVAMGLSGSSLLGWLKPDLKSVLILSPMGKSP